MAKIIAISIILFSFSAQAKFECYLLLENRGAVSPDSMQLSYAKNWVETQGGILNDSKNSQLSQINILEKWQSWRNLTRMQRDRALTLELLKISPPTGPGPIVLFDVKSLEALSAENLPRMLERVNDLFPLSGTTNPALNKMANTITSRLRFAHIRPVNPYQTSAAPLGYDAPVASPRELGALGLVRGESYYSWLVGTSPSVEFQFHAAKTGAGPAAAVTKREVYVLNDNFAKENGFVLPRFHSSIDLLDFFDFWDPESAEQMFRANWIGLPKEIRSYQQFREFIKSVDDANNIFHPQGAYTQMAILRTHLRNFVLTPADAEQFLKAAFKRYLVWLGNHDFYEAQALAVNLSGTPALNRFFSGEFMELLHISYGLGLRIPIAVSAENFTLSRVEDGRNPYVPRRFLPTLEATPTNKDQP